MKAEGLEDNLVGKFVAEDLSIGVMFLFTLSSVC
jgi:hypothetical protein